ncbi:MAG: asparaginyl/glutamyl-tRNA amidotransferase subunit C [Deltaproteobacteria bacterium RIFOXYD12_FULL_57_12]|nr:MAG: asparaginyl/glutamyl-tRNA amidotransferase subunit C [Deltaproteobacteria bacterium RIFOXYD12_FULL_57_12]
MKITPEETEHVARLAHLDLSAVEVHAMTEQLDRILSYVAKLNALETEGVQPTTHALAIHNAFRADEVHSSLTQAEALANGPQQNGEAFVVPRII